MGSVVARQCSRKQVSGPGRSQIGGPPKWLVRSRVRVFAPYSPKKPDGAPDGVSSGTLSAVSTPPARPEF
jgi:hypothetical protein